MLTLALGDSNASFSVSFSLSSRSSTLIMSFLFRFLLGTFINKLIVVPLPLKPSTSKIFLPLPGFM
ncbi:uncharacterized protein METZ01_LOCUS178320 [marine metagenome]|uniref:Uncharacterized protein n=1 Tax=marine metagenome TaxID=408172 RepID=A0A382CH74_9ZZZZ